MSPKLSGCRVADIYGTYFNELYVFLSQILGFSVLTGLTVDKFKDTPLDHRIFS